MVASNSSLSGLTAQRALPAWLWYRHTPAPSLKWVLLFQRRMRMYMRSLALARWLCPAKAH
eukprot:36458-Pleurochrysis_carterae.AAC.1